MDIGFVILISYFAFGGTQAFLVLLLSAIRNERIPEKTKLISAFFAVLWPLMWVGFAGAGIIILVPKFCEFLARKIKKVKK